jgi:class 3 adenylate cyclase
MEPIFSAKISTDYIALIFTDLVNSTALKDSMPGNSIRERNQAYRDRVLFLHRKRITESLITYRGRVVEPPQGDSFLLEFTDPIQAIEWAIFIQRSHSQEPINTPLGLLEVKIGIHYGAPLRDGDRLIGQEVDYASRIVGLAMGGQILLSKVTSALIEDGGIRAVKVHFKGEYELKGIGKVPIFELLYDDKLNEVKSEQCLKGIEIPTQDKSSESLQGETNNSTVSVQGDVIGVTGTNTGTLNFGNITR